MMFLTPGTETLSLRPRPLGTSASIVTFTDRTPGMALTSSCAAFFISSRTGQAGVVNTMRKETLPPSIFRSLMKPSVTMSLCRSGSLIWRSASRTIFSFRLILFLNDSTREQRKASSELAADSEHPVAFHVETGEKSEKEQGPNRNYSVPTTTRSHQ